MEKMKVDFGKNYEYESGAKLTGSASKYISIPMSVILDDEIDNKRVAVFSYLRTHCGLNDVVNYTIPDIVEWCRLKPNRMKDGMNDKILNVIDALNDRGYLTYLTEPKRTRFTKCEIDLDKITEECQNGFAFIYLDELEKIMSYKRKNIKNVYLTSTTILLVFAYLRAKIYRRPNKLRKEEMNIDGSNNRNIDIGDRRNKNPEAYADSFVKMAEELGISDRTFINVVNVLEDELGLIVTDKAYRYKNKEGEYRTPYTIFANAYKREDKYLLADGEEYSRKETEEKAKVMHELFGIYKINKNKRKTKGGDGDE